MSDNVQKIKEEIEKRIRLLNKVCNNKECETTIAYKDILKFIDSLPKQPASEDLEEASWNYSDRDGIGYGQRYAMQIDFKAGAEWQRQRMMKDAVETIIVDDWQYGKDPVNVIFPAIHQRIEGFDVGDKVKIIIVKEEQ